MLLRPLFERRPPAIIQSFGAPALLAGAAGLLVLLVVVAVGIRLAGSGTNVATGDGTTASAAPRVGLARPAPIAAPPADTALEGLVRSEAGQPVPGALVAVRAPSARLRTTFGDRPVRLAATATTAADGRFRLTGLPAGSLVVSATHAEHAAAYVREVVTTPARAATCEIVRPPPRFTLSGQVNDSGGGPIAGARLLVTGTWDAVFAVVTDAQGRYRLPVASWVSGVQVEASGYAFTATGLLRADADITRDFSLAPPARLAGTVVSGPGSSPVAGVEVRVIPTRAAGATRLESSARTDAEGRFAIEDLPAGEYRLFARQGALVTPKPVSFDPAPGAAEQTELVEPGVAVRGRLTAANGPGIADAGVYLLEDGVAAAEAPLASAETDGSGRFAFEAVGAGRYRLAVSARGFAVRDRVVDVHASSRFELALVADALTLVRGVVVTSQGRPGVGARLEASTRPRGGSGTGGLSFAEAGPDGRFELPDLRAGDLTISAMLGRESAFFGPVELGASEQKEVKIPLVPGSFVSGMVRYEDWHAGPGRADPRQHFPAGPGPLRLPGGPRAGSGRWRGPLRGRTVLPQRGEPRRREQGPARDLRTPEPALGQRWCRWRRAST